jgi:glyoxylase-like metal-dependent hydrolase (beta-lactamase superfamily II)
VTTERVGESSAGGVRVERLVVPEGAHGSSDGDPVVGHVNAWLVGDHEECVVIDPPADAEAVLDAVGERQLTAVLFTHCAPGEVTSAPALLEARPRTRIGVQAGDVEAWDASHPDLHPNLHLSDGDIVTTGDIELIVLHTPGHTPGSCCFHAPDLGVLFPGPTDVSTSERLRGLAPETVVHPARGESTTLRALSARSSPAAGSAHST